MQRLRRLERAELKLLFIGLGLCAVLFLFIRLASEVMEGDTLAFDEQILRSLAPEEVRVVEHRGDLATRSLLLRPNRLEIPVQDLDERRTVLLRDDIDQVERIHVRAAPLEDCGEAYDVVINASSSSVHGAGIPVPARVLRPGALALDMMYGPSARAYLAWADAHGAIGRDGLGMLVEQAAEAFEVFRGVQPETRPVLAALRLRMEQASS